MAKRKKSNHSRVLSKKHANFAVKFAETLKKLQKSYRQATQEIPTLKPSLVASSSFIFGFLLSSHLLPINLSSAASNIDAESTAKITPSTQSPKSYPEKTAAASDAEANLAASYAGSIQTIASKANSANLSANSIPASGLYIPALNISSAVIPSSLSGKELSVPSSGVGFYGSLYFGHSSGVFASLRQASVGQTLYLNGMSYTISSVELNQSVWSDRQGVGSHHMRQLINLGSSQIVLMTCAGSYVEGFGWSGRTLVFATLN